MYSCLSSVRAAKLPAGATPLPHVAARLGADAMTLSHQAADRLVGEPAARGRGDGTFSTNAPEGWLAMCRLTLFHGFTLFHG